MSLRVGFDNNLIPQNSGYASGASGQAAMPPDGKKSVEQGQTIDSIRNDKLMKKIGAVECQTCRNRKPARQRITYRAKAIISQPACAAKPTTSSAGGS